MHLQTIPHRNDFYMFPAVLCFFSSRRRHTRCLSDWSSDVCSSDLLRASQIVRVSGFCTHTCLPRSIAHMAAVACMKSGMVTITASMPFSLSSILRKSLYLGTFSYWLNLLAACFSSTSHSATMFSDAQLVRSLAALPPAP